MMPRLCRLLVSPAAVMQFNAVLSICGGHVKKGTGREQSHDSHKELLRQNVERQLKVMEGIIEKLLAGLDISALGAKERLGMTARFIALYQRGISIDNSLDANRVVKYESMAIESVIRRIVTEEEREDFRIIDADTSLYLGIEEDDQDDERPYERSLGIEEDDQDDERPYKRSLGIEEDDQDGERPYERSLGIEEDDQDDERP